MAVNSVIPLQTLSKTLLGFFSRPVLVWVLSAMTCEVINLLKLMKSHSL